MVAILALYKKRRAGLKKLTLLFLASVLSLFLLTTISCNNLFENPLEEKTSESEEPETINNPELKRLGKSGIYISLVQPESLQQNLASRTVLPDIDTSTLTAISLSGSRNGEDSINIGVWDSFSQMAGLIELDAGEWDLELSASSNNFLFRDTKHVSLSVGQTQRISFALNTSAGGGGIDFKISFPANVQKLEYTFSRYSSGSFTSIENAPNAVIRTEGTGKYFIFQRTSSNPVDPGTYKLELRFWGDTAKTQLLNTFCELINVKAGFISRSTDRSINLNQMHTITYKTESGSALNASEYTIKDSLGNNTSLPVNYTANSGTITLPVLEKTGYIFEGWYTADNSGNLSASPVTRIAETDSGDKEFRAVFIIEMKEGAAFHTTINNWNGAERMVPSTTPPDSSVTITHYLDTGTNVPVWYDTTESCIKYYAAGYTDGTSKLYLRPDSGSMFNGSFRFKVIDLTPFDTSRVTDMSNMFNGCNMLETVYVSSAFTTTAVISSENMFNGCSTLLKGENGFSWSSTKSKDATYAKINTATQEGYFWSQPTSPIYFITYELNEGTNASGNPASYTSSTLPITLANPGRQNAFGDNFIFDGWYTSSTFIPGTQVTAISDTSYGNVTLYAKWKVPYRVKHMQQNVTGSGYTEAVSDLQVLYGYAGENTSAAAMPYTGFTAQTITQEPIVADGSTVIEIKYDRQTFNVTYTGGGVVSGSVTLPVAPTNIRYGASVTPAYSGITCAGYTFAGWLYNGTIYKSTGPTSFEMPASNVTLTAQWTANTNTSYIVKHMKQNTADDEYTEVTADRLSLTGTTGANTSAEANPYEGFTAQTVIQKPIAGDGSTVVEIKYDRRTYTVTYDDGLPDKDLFSTINGSYRYGATVNVVIFGSTEYYDNQNPGYSFTGWKYGSIDYPKGVAASFPMPASNVTLTAQWSLKTYTIEYNLHNGNWADAYSPPATYTINSPDITLPTAENVVRDGYIFTGWYLNSMGTGTNYSIVPAGSSSNKMYHAGWAEKVKSVSSVDAAVTAIQNAPAGQTVKVTCALSSDNTELAQIVSAISAKSTPVGLDLSQTGMTEITTSFSTANYLCNIVLPDALTKIGSGVFNGCSSSVPAYPLTLPKDCIEITPGSRSLCGNFSAFIMEPGGNSELYSDEDGVLYSTGTIGGTTPYMLLDYPAGKATVDSYTITCNYVYKDALSGRRNIKKIIISSNVMGIDSSAFANNAPTLTAVEIQLRDFIGSPLHIDSGVFNQNNKLTSFTYTGTKAQWASNVDRNESWLGTLKPPATYVQCDDGNSTRGFE